MSLLKNKQMVFQSTGWEVWKVFLRREVLAQELVIVICSQTFARPVFKLAHAFTRNVELFSDFVCGEFPVGSYPKRHLYHPPLDFGK